MGGALPLRNQRVLGVGGTAGLVHPSTGYMVARTMGAVPQLADRVVDEVEALKQRGRRSGALLLAVSSSPSQWTLGPACTLCHPFPVSSARVTFSGPLNCSHCRPGIVEAICTSCEASSAYCEQASDR